MPLPFVGFDLASECPIRRLGLASAALATQLSTEK
jgi:hypothetical protein